jgi:hypothetical protein
MFPLNRGARGSRGEQEKNLKQAYKELVLVTFWWFASIGKKFLPIRVKHQNSLSGGYLPSCFARFLIVHQSFCQLTRHY